MTIGIDVSTRSSGYIDDFSGGIGVYAPNIETIQGQMITASIELDEHQIVTMDDVAIKNKVLNMLMNELLSAKSIEFTKQQNLDRNTTTIRARIFATPDSQIRIVRTTTK